MTNIYLTYILIYYYVVTLFVFLFNQVKFAEWLDEANNSNGE